MDARGRRAAADLPDVGLARAVRPGVGRSDAYDASMRPTLRRRLLLAVCTVQLVCALSPLASQALPDEARLERLRQYIKMGWTTLTRSNRDLPRALPDPKMPRKPGEPWLLYVSRAGIAHPRAGRAEARARRRGDEARSRSGRCPRDVSSDPRTWPAVSSSPVCRPGRTLQRDVRMGQLLHPGRTAPRRRDRAGPGHGRELRLRDRALRHDPQRQSHLLSLALAAAVPDADGPGRIRADAATRPGCGARCPRSSSTIDSGRPSHMPSPTSGCRATSIAGRPGGRGLADERDEQGRTHYDRAREYFRTHESPATTSRATTTAGATA